ncbi:MAG: sulfur carrier protein ThiS [Rubripirellula sp.]|nr:sulfur carrier protein ThiS [Rubripirellula sp.]
MIEILVNGKTVSIPDAITLEKVLRSVEVPPNYLAVEINGEVVPKEQHASTIVRDGDELEVVTLVGGG